MESTTFKVGHFTNLKASTTVDGLLLSGQYQSLKFNVTRFVLIYLDNNIIAKPFANFILSFVITYC